MSVGYDPVSAEKAIRERAPALGCTLPTDEFVCQVCMEKLPIEARFWNSSKKISCHCKGCCVPCVNRGVEINLADDTAPIDPYRKRALDDDVLIWLLSQHDFKIDFAAYREKMTLRMLEKKMIACPSCHLQSAGDYSCPNVECPHCDAKFCLDCHQLRDGGESDHDCPVRKWITDQKESERYYAPENAPKEKWKFGDEVREDMKDSSYYQSGKVTRCPECGTLCQKMIGCDSVRCPMKECRHSFVWSKVKAL